ncbi:hypothetical protein [Streptomyces coeruleorubidus]|uniref:hypothetical protein n=1 Tax=Streptomyces coeruleorubidus TaxID=116188 RepID=UPI001E2F7B97|nr:hypothetical protein [Streptomyces coeruleorubidus]
MGELVFDRAHQVLTERERRRPHEEEIAQAAANLLDRAADGPEGGAERSAVQSQGRRRAVNRRDRKVAARTRATSTPTWPRPEPPSANRALPPEPDPGPEAAEENEEVAKVVPLGIFDAREEAKRWW